MNIGLIYLNENNGEAMPIGLVTLAGVLKHKYPHHTVRIIDINFEDPLETIINSEFDLIGISCATCEYETACELASKIRKKTSIPLLLGGVHISTLPNSFRDCFDLGVIGEGEHTLCELVAAYENKGAFDHENIQKIAGLVYFHNGQLLLTAKRALIDDLNTVPKLDYSFLNKKYFRRRPLILRGMAGREAFVQSSRGCPYKCRFCSTTQFWHKVRRFSVERFIDEVSDLVENYGVDHIQIWDDLFTVGKDRLREIAKEFRARSLHKKVKMNCSSRANVIDDELCDILKSINIDIVGFGFESGNDRVLEYLKGGSVTVAQNKEAINVCVRNNMKICGTLMFGSPTETIAEMEDTLSFIDFAKSKNVYSLLCFITTPYPATEMWAIAEARGLVSDDMRFDKVLQLSLNSPLLLDEDVDIEDFRRVFNKAAQSESFFRYQKIRVAFATNPMGALFTGLLYFWPIFKRLYGMRAHRKEAYLHDRESYPAG